jgi:hypothetical protein
VASALSVLIPSDCSANARLLALLCVLPSCRPGFLASTHGTWLALPFVAYGSLARLAGAS